MKAPFVLFFAFVLSGCYVDPPIVEQGDFMVRDVWYHSHDACVTLVLETDDGQVVSREVNSNYGIPVWKGMRVRMTLVKTFRLDCRNGRIESAHRID